MALMTLPLEIPSGQALSAPLTISQGLRIVRIGMPDAWSPAAAITFQISPDNIDWRDLYHVAQTAKGEWMPYEVSVPSVVPNSILLLPPDMGASIAGLKIRSGTAAHPVNQAADRAFTLVFDSGP